MVVAFVAVAATLLLIAAAPTSTRYVGVFVGNGAALTNAAGGIGGCIASGVVTLVSGTNKVSTSAANLTNVVVLTPYSVSGTAMGTVGYRTIVADTSFIIFSSSSIDTNKVSWAIFKP